MFTVRLIFNDEDAGVIDFHILPCHSELANWFCDSNKYFTRRFWFSFLKFHISLLKFSFLDTLALLS
jgi:hypothetical protein